mmetsp:Transcript_25232/g.71155  ORF Transcript_25232/g.71155 Transcript_25232/m.71155 type:complete len:293 (+) Transcript_25232:1441-2319(+)
MLPEHGAMLARPEVVAVDHRRREEVPARGPQPGGHQRLLAEEQVLEARVVRDLAHHARGREGEPGGPEERGGGRPAEALGAARLAGRPQEAVGGAELARADDDGARVRVELRHVGAAGRVVVGQGVARGVGREDGLLARAAPQLCEEPLVPPLDHPVVAVELEDVVLPTEQLPLNESPRVARAPRAGVVEEGRPNLRLVLAQVQQEAPRVLAAVGLPADAHENPPGAPRLTEQVQHGILALRVAVARDRHEYRRASVPGGRLGGAGGRVGALSTCAVHGPSAAAVPTGMSPS